jgi:SAM-dependent methyltransferase
MPVDSKQSEKEYLRRTAAGDWELFKPFSPPGAHTLDDSAALIHDFSVALSTLRPGPGDLILDLGAGACWCSDWLGRLNLRSVAVDISLDMLRLGTSRRHEGLNVAAVGDMERLPFADGVFDKAICLSALHHVPNMAQALVEIRRVLKPAGVAFFSEPGKGHADKPWSVAAMRDFGVLEQDILVTTFVEQCRRAGFADVRMKPMAYVIPEFDLTLEEWRAWHTLGSSKRPWRATQKMWRAVLEFFGLRKKDLLFEEAFAIILVRLLKGAMDEHPIVVASGTPMPKFEPDRFLARVRLIGVPAAARIGGRVSFTARIRNEGNQPWPAEAPAGGGIVRIGVQLLDADEKLINRDFFRVSLPQTMAPGESLEIPITCPAPEPVGVYHLKVDLVQEGVAWFEPKGSESPSFRLSVG